MPPDEGLALHEAEEPRFRQVPGGLVEVGTYCGKSTIYLGAAAPQRDQPSW